LVFNCIPRTGRQPQRAGQVGGDLCWGPMATEPLEAAEQFRLTTTRCTYSSSISEFFFALSQLALLLLLHCAI